MLQNGNEIERSAPSNEREVKVASVAQSQIAVDQLVAEVVVRLFPTSVLNSDSKVPSQILSKTNT